MRTRGRTAAFLVFAFFAVTTGTVAWLLRHDLRSRYVLWRNFESLGHNAFGYPEYRHRETGITFVHLPGGTFSMGSPETEVGRHHEEGPVHEVTLSAFLIAKYEVTAAQWRRVLENVSGKAPNGHMLPAAEVSWYRCREFCTKTGLSLPTEAQWEYACRGGKAGAVAGTGNLDEMGWYVANSNGEVQPIGQKTPNDFGLHDMHGNVREWCEDVYDRHFYSKPESTQKNPVSLRGPTGGRVVRGGDYGDTPGRCRSAFRAWAFRANRSVDVGFRPTVPLRVMNAETRK